MDAVAGKTKKLSQLRELIFLDNPLRDGELRVNGAEKYRRFAPSTSSLQFSS